MSTLRVTNVQDTSGGNSLTTAQIYSGSAKAWVNFNGQGAIVIRNQFNVSSITDGGVGTFTLIFTTALAGGDYAVAGSTSAGTGTAPTSGGANLAGSCAINTPNAAGTLTDFGTTCVCIFR